MGFVRRAAPLPVTKTEQQDENTKIPRSSRGHARHSNNKSGPSSRPQYGRRQLLRKVSPSGARVAAWTRCGAAKGSPVRWRAREGEISRVLAFMHSLALARCRRSNEIKSRCTLARTREIPSNLPIRGIAGRLDAVETSPVRDWTV